MFMTYQSEDEGKLRDRDSICRYILPSGGTVIPKVSECVDDTFSMILISCWLRHQRITLWIFLDNSIVIPNEDRLTVHKKRQWLALRKRAQNLLSGFFFI